MRALWLLIAVAACESSSTRGDVALTSPLGVIPEEPQRPGDPEAGYHALVNESYVSCGIPKTAYDQASGALPSGATIPGREGKNVDLPYFLTSFVAKSGVEVVTANCLLCHAGQINGELVVGLGNAASDFTQNQGFYAQLAGGFLTDEKEIAEWQKWAGRMKAIGPYIMASTLGVNAADNLAAALFAHRDPKTLAWSDEPLMEPPSPTVIPVDVPPWWRMKKKHAMFYGTGGRGDHARIMMSASALCTDSVEEALQIDAYFPNVRAYISSLTAPKYPFAVTDERAARGKTVFGANCARCHGTYDEPWTYPNLVVGVDEVGTDPLLAVGASQFGDRFVNWFNASFYGEVARLAPAAGYVAPPLDGIWATAPFLHNGSVPTLRALLDSKTRPRYWTRSFDSRDYDPAAIGWKYSVVDHGQDAEDDYDLRIAIYDTTQTGYGNGGHTFGDALSAEERNDLLEYLKSL